MTEKQRIADELKQIAERRKRGRSSRLCIETLEAIQKLERAAWIPAAWQDAAPADPPKDDQGLSCRAISARINRYLTLIASPEAPPAAVPTQPAFPAEKDLFTVQEAAKYLNVSHDTIKRWVFRTGELAGEMFGNTRLFRRADLDALGVRKANQRMGRPFKSKSPP